MIWFAMLALLIWVPIVYLIFESMPVNKAVVFSFVFAWLFLPTLPIQIGGLPDWTKMSATTFGVSLIAYSKHFHRLSSFRFRWYDLPVVIYCLCPIASSLANNQGVYEGASACLTELINWGLPYLIGRIFLADERGNHLLCYAIALGGLVYVPLCLFEMRMSPILKLWVYGYNERAALDFSLRYGGYRPIVFLSFGLETGWWMCCASLACYNLWRSGAVKRINGYPLGFVTVGIILVTIACKSTGALVQIFCGSMIFGLARYLKKSAIVWSLLVIPPVYCICRPLGIWTGATLLDLSTSLFGPARAQSLGYRFEQEELLMNNALRNPILGLSRSGGFNIGPNGREIVTDGFWVIVFGTTGCVGLAALILMLMLPTVLFLRRFPVREWLEPEVAPTLTLAMILPLCMIDNLSNAMLNPIYAVAMGAVSGCLPGARMSRLGPAKSSSPGRTKGLAGSGGSSTSDATYSQIGDEAESAAVDAARQDRHDEAWEQFNFAVENRQAAVSLLPSSDYLDRLARTQVLFARFLTALGYPQYAIDQRSEALRAWRLVADRTILGGDVLHAHGTNLNDLAWLLISEPGAAHDAVSHAVTLAEEAVQIAPTAAAHWNTLGIAYYRNQDHYKAIRSLSRAVSLDETTGGNAFDFYYLALANQALGYAKPARDWLDFADVWVEKHPDLAGSLLKVRGEVASVFGAS